MQVLNFRETQQQGLTTPFGSAAVAIHANMECFLHSVENVLSVFARVAEGLDYSPFNYISRSQSRG